MIGVISLTLIGSDARGDGALDPIPSAKAYISGFGGGGASTYGNLSQSGIALYGTSQGGPLVVNAYGRGVMKSVGVGGGNVGYEWRNVKNQQGFLWGLVPAVEFEGFYLGGRFRGEDINNETARLDEHDFIVSYPMRTGVLLANVIVSGHYLNLDRIHPYLGFGIGPAIVSISGANSLQTTPAEPGINHYNSNPNASQWVLAVQPKVGLRLNVTDHASIFAEYRFLYLAPTNFQFGSTQYPTHIATTNWAASLGPMHYNLGTAGIRYECDV